MTIPEPTPDELEAIRQRFISAQTSVPRFANWIANHALPDMRWLLGTIDGLHLGYRVLLAGVLDEMFAEDDADE